jgi:uncharacterized membrane protein required for colicin V production
MILDILIVVIVLISMVMGKRTGFFLMIFHSIGWLVSIVAGLLLYPFAAGFIASQAGYPGGLYANVTSRLRNGISARADELLGEVPDSIVAPIEKSMREMTATLADGVASVCFSVMVFLTIVLGIKLLAYVFTKLVAGVPKKGLVGNVNTLLGIILGNIQGVLIVYVLLAAILPVSLVIGKEANSFVEDALFSSMFARDLYNNNPLLFLANYFLEL